MYMYISEDRASRLIHLPAHNFYKNSFPNFFNFTFVWQTFDEDAEFEVFFEVGVPEVRFFFILSSSAGGRVIKSR